MILLSAVRGIRRGYEAIGDNALIELRGLRRVHPQPPAARHLVVGVDQLGRRRQPSRPAAVRRGGAARAPVRRGGGHRPRHRRPQHRRGLGGRVRHLAHGRADRGDRRPGHHRRARLDARERVALRPVAAERAGPALLAPAVHGVGGDRRRRGPPAAGGGRRLVLHGDPPRLPVPRADPAGVRPRRGRRATARRRDRGGSATCGRRCGTP